MDEYNPIKLEPKWQKAWQKGRVFEVDLADKQHKFYNLVMLPYPSGEALHLGHAYNYFGADSLGRFKKMEGFNVFQPIGFDAFGLPAENYAISVNKPPAQSIADNVKTFRQQIDIGGFGFDRSREVVTSDPEYYKWTQWLFLKMYEKGLAYRKASDVNWCPSCQTVLAREQVVSGLCERCDSETGKKNLKQWYWKMSQYAQRLLDNHEKLDWPESTIASQKNWIGRSEGLEIKFKVSEKEMEISVFTSRPDTIYGVTFMVVAPESPLVEKLITADQADDVLKYIAATKKKTDLERVAEGKGKTGVFSGRYAINPVNNEKIPIWIADYVLTSYGTGAIMAVPAHDQRDFDLAKKYDLPIKPVVRGDEKPDESKAYEGEGKAINSGEFDGQATVEFKKNITVQAEEEGWGEAKINYKLHDWLMSRQRYWGAPIPIIHCPDCGEVPVPENELPIKLPGKVDFKNQTEESPLAAVESFVNTKCPKCQKPAKREVDTMDTFVCSSWYYLRYLSPDKEDGAWDGTMVKNWLPVDLYVGGREHSNMHLIYARFVAMALKDMGLLPFEEPFPKLRHQGLILAADGHKMSKSKKNDVKPDEFVKKHGSDVLRMHLLFMGPFTAGGPWNSDGILGIKRFLKRVWTVVLENQTTGKPENQDAVWHATIKKAGEDYEKMHFNTAIAALMELVNATAKDGWSIDQKMVFVRLLTPLAPHLAEELWNRLGGEGLVASANWPRFDPKLAKTDTITLVVQVNGKTRDKLEVAADIGKDEAIEKAKASQNVKKHIGDKEIKKAIYVTGRLVNLVV